MAIWRVVLVVGVAGALGCDGTATSPGGPPPPGNDAGPSSGPDASAPDAGQAKVDGGTGAPRDAGPGGVGFATPAKYDVGSAADPFIGNAAAMNVVTGDFNGDGKIDIAVTHGSDQTVYVFLNTGNGTFAAGATYPVPNGPIANLYLADFNRDGKLDLGVPGGGTPGNGFVQHPIVLLGKGDGTFGAPIASGSLGPTRGVTVCDFNGDGIPDFASNNPSTGTVSVSLGKGDGTFGPAIVSPRDNANYSRWITCADFDGDGKMDVAIADGNGVRNQVGTCEISVLFGKGDGTFRTGGTYPSPPTQASWGGAPPPVDGGPTVNPEDVFAIDVNADGKPDLIETLYDHNINVFINNGDGTFQPAAGYITGEYPRAVTAADMNGDGILDLVVGNVGCMAALAGSCLDAPGSVAVMIGNGGGTFQAPVVLRPFQFPEWVALADFDGDGLPDLAVTSVQDDHTLDILINHSSP
jgi:hypothetical protein